MEDKPITTEEIVANLKEKTPDLATTPAHVEAKQGDEGDEVVDSGTTSTTFTDRPS